MTDREKQVYIIITIIAVIIAVYAAHTPYKMVKLNYNEVAWDIGVAAPTDYEEIMTPIKMIGFVCEVWILLYLFGLAMYKFH